MKNIITICLSLIISITTSLSAKDKFDSDKFDLICIDPLISDKDKRSKVNRSIDKGYSKQLRNLYNKVTRSEFDNINIKYNLLKNNKIAKDKKAGKEFLAMLESVNNYFLSTDANKKTKLKNSNPNEFSSGDEDEFDFSETELTELSNNENKEDKYKTLFVDAMDEVIDIYGNEKEGNLWPIPFSFMSGIENITPNVVFGEYFNPSKRGRRYFLNINIFFFIIDQDGDVMVMSKEISDFNWKRNFRFISSQSGKVIQDTISKFTGLDIK